MKKQVTYKIRNTWKNVFLLEKFSTGLKIE